jgi:hypothetical protein
MKIKKTAFGVFLALATPSMTTAQDAYYQPYSMASCLGIFSPAFTPSPELSERLQTSARPKRLELIAQARMRDAVNMHRAEQCTAMREGRDPEPCPVGEAIMFDPFLADVIAEFAGADIATIEAGLSAESTEEPPVDVVEICKK